MISRALILFQIMKQKHKRALRHLANALDPTIYKGFNLYQIEM